MKGAPHVGKSASRGGCSRKGMPGVPTRQAAQNMFNASSQQSGKCKC
jgi:hypothetical protein